MVVTEIIVVVLLVLLNGFFSASELAIVSSRRARLVRRAAEGSRGARVALALKDDPGRFLSTVQFGITLIGIIAGAYSGAALSAPLADVFNDIEWLAPYAPGLAFALVVIAITYLSLILGELVPKQIALNHAEGWATFAAPTMKFVSWLGSPIVWVLRRSTDGVLKLIPKPKPSADEDEATEDEVKDLVAEGTRKGVFEESERELIHGVLRMADVPVKSIMTARSAMVWLDPDDDVATLRKRMLDAGHSRYPVWRERTSTLLGWVSEHDVLPGVLGGEAPDFERCTHPPMVIPENMSALKLLESFREQRTHIAFVASQYGSIEGLVTPTDVLDELAGKLSPFFSGETGDIVHRPDGTILADGLVDLGTLEDAFGVRGPLTAGREAETVAGLVLRLHQIIPKVGDVIEDAGFRFEVMDMDGWRIDRVLVSRPVANGSQGHDNG
jgi:putative hemolysin